MEKEGNTWNGNTWFLEKHGDNDDEDINFKKF